MNELDLTFFIKKRERRMSLNELLFEEALNKLHDNHHQLTKEEEEFILKIANRIISDARK
jgi:hypothetical protein